MGEAKFAFGRPVVFVNPSYLLKTFVIQRLLEMEYEVYYVESPRNVKAVLSSYSNALCLIDVDTSMASAEFLNLIDSIERNPEYSEVMVGVLTRRIASLLKEYTEKLTLKAGFICTAANKESILESLTSLFNSYEVKGRRQFVRVSLPPGSGAQFYCKIQGLPTHFPLRDISSCGFACEAVGYPEAAFTQNALIPGELQLGTTILPCSVVLFAIKKSGRSLMLVMLFAQTNAWSNKKTIREFVAETLQKKIDEIRATGKIDDMDYSKQDESLPPRVKTKTDEQKDAGEEADAEKASEAPAEPAQPTADESRTDSGQAAAAES